MNFLGDVHGKYNKIPKMLNVIQVGDMGVGFEPLPKLPSTFRFIRGNHDTPSLCYQCQNYLGDYGYFGDIFFVSGAYSVDRLQRIPYASWFPNEELTVVQANLALEGYVGAETVVSHDCPQSVAEELFGANDRTFTRVLLDEILTKNPPERWVFGHWHKSVRKRIGKTLFVGLAELELY